MRCSVGLGIVVCLILSGCGPLKHHRTTTWLNQINPFAGNPGDKIVVRTYLLEQPVGDTYLTHDLWTQTLKPLPAEKHALLGENGLRVGHFTGNPPYQFLTLARGPDVVKPLESTVLAGDAKLVPLAGPVPEMKFQSCAEIGMKPGQFDLKDVEIALSLTPSFGENGKVKLAFEPRVQHGHRQFGWRPTTDNTAFTWLDQKVQERFPTLKCEISLSPEEYLLIGPTEVPANTLGGASFVNVTEGKARMRVLVIQVGKLASAPAEPNPGRKPGVVAAQASRPIARGQAD
ncbi:hypothetical protein BH11PLA2_BH11PLA2_40610 [soil metagenome]